MSHQPSPTASPSDNSRVFIGRVQEKRHFAAALQGLVTHQARWLIQTASEAAVLLNALPADQSYPKIFILHGIGGIGKTEMARQCLKMAQELNTEPDVLTFYLDVSTAKPAIRHWTDLLAHLGEYLGRAGFRDALQPYEKSERDEIEVRKEVERYKTEHREVWEIIQQMAAEHCEREGHAPDSQAVSTRATGLLMAQMQEENHLTVDRVSLYLEPDTARSGRFTTGLKQIACQQPLVIALDTLEVKDFIPLEPFLRDHLVLPTLDAPLIWILSGRHNLDEDRQVEIEGQKQAYRGYRELIEDNPPLAWDMKTFTEADIRDYLQTEAERRETPLDLDETLLATIKATTRGVPLALNMVADALFALPRDAFLREFAITDETLLPAEHVEKLIKRFLRYCLHQQEDVYRVQGMALLLKGVEAEALRQVWALPGEQSVREVLHHLRSQYTFMRGETLHDAVYDFVRRELRTAPALSEVRQEIGRSAYEYYHDLWRTEHRDIDRDPAERTREPRWQEATRHKLNSLFWYKPDEAMQFLRFGLIEGLGFDRRFARELLEQAQEFMTHPNTIPLQNSHIDELRRLSNGLNAYVAPSSKWGDLFEWFLDSQKSSPADDLAFGEMLDLLLRLPNLEPLHQSILYLHQGNALASQKAYERAFERYTQAERALPDEAGQLREQLGEAFAEIGQTSGIHMNEYGGYYNANAFPLVLKAFQKAIDLGIETVRLYQVRGEIENLVGNHEAAKKSYLQAIKLDPQDASSHGGLGIVYSYLGHHDEALVAYKKAIEIDPKSAFRYRSLGDAHSYLGHHDEALVAYKKAIEINPKLRSVHNNIAGVYLDLGQLDEASKHLQRRIELGPDDALNALVTLGVILWYQDHTVEAQQQFESALALWDTAWQRRLQSEAGLLENKALALLGLGQTGDALSELQEALVRRLPGDKIELVRYDLLASAPEPPPGLAEMSRLLDMALNEEES